MAKTTRIPDTWAGPGAVNQHGGNLPVYRCNDCGREVVWAESARTGRRYLVTVSRGHLEQRFYVGRNVHDCEALQAADAELATELQARADRLAAFDRVRDMPQGTPAERAAKLAAIDALAVAR